MNTKAIKGYFSIVALAAISFSANAQVPDKLIDPANMDLNVKPGDDFYNYASGTWIRNNPVPPKETRWGSFNMLRDFNINAVKGLLADAAGDKSAAAGSVKRRVGDFYKAAMDSTAIEKLGYTPIKSDLQRVRQLANIQAILDHVTQLRVSGVAAPMYGFSVGQDRKNVTKYAVQLSQGGTTLPNRDYYLKDDSRSAQIR
ncbi:MAG: M13 family peptidase, partial [Pedobacter sp.]